MPKPQILSREILEERNIMSDHGLAFTSKGEGTWNIMRKVRGEPVNSGLGLFNEPRGTYLFRCAAIFNLVLKLLSDYRLGFLAIQEGPCSDNEKDADDKETMGLAIKDLLEHFEQDEKDPSLYKYKQHIENEDIYLIYRGEFFNFIKQPKGQKKPKLLQFTQHTDTPCTVVECANTIYVNAHLLYKLQPEAVNAWIKKIFKTYQEFRKEVVILMDANKKACALDASFNIASAGYNNIVYQPGSETHVLDEADCVVSNRKEKECLTSDLHFNKFNSDAPNLFDDLLGHEITEKAATTPSAEEQPGYPSTSYEEQRGDIYPALPQIPTSISYQPSIGGTAQVFTPIFTSPPPIYTGGDVEIPMASAPDVPDVVDFPKKRDGKDMSQEEIAVAKFFTVALCQVPVARMDKVESSSYWDANVSMLKSACGFPHDISINEKKREIVIDLAKCFDLRVLSEETLPLDSLRYMARERFEKSLASLGIKVEKVEEHRQTTGKQKSLEHYKLRVNPECYEEFLRHVNAFNNVLLNTPNEAENYLSSYQQYSKKSPVALPKRPELGLSQIMIDATKFFAVVCCNVSVEQMEAEEKKPPIFQGGKTIFCCGFPHKVVREKGFVAFNIQTEFNYRNVDFSQFPPPGFEPYQLREAIYKKVELSLERLGISRGTILRVAKGVYEIAIPESALIGHVKRFAELLKQGKIRNADDYFRLATPSAVKVAAAPSNIGFLASSAAKVAAAPQEKSVREQISELHKKLTTEVKDTFSFFRETKQNKAKFLKDLEEELNRYSVENIDKAVLQDRVRAVMQKHASDLKNILGGITSRVRDLVKEVFGDTYEKEVQQALSHAVAAKESFFTH